jgi:hypothetical protein
MLFFFILVIEHFIVQIHALNGLNGTPIIRKLGLVLIEYAYFCLLYGDLVLKVRNLDLLLVYLGVLFVYISIEPLDLFQGEFVVISHLVVLDSDLREIGCSLCAGVVKFF